MSWARVADPAVSGRFARDGAEPKRFLLLLLTPKCDSSHSREVRSFGITCHMKSARAQCNTLTVSDELKKTLETLGRTERFSSTQELFREDSGNAGVFLVLSGKVCLSVKGVPKLDRFFSSGAVLGLPSTFTGHVYSLTATALADSNTVRVPQEEFLHLMRERPDLCREATEILGREVTFIQSALAERRKQMVSRRVACSEFSLMT